MKLDRQTAPREECEAMHRRWPVPACWRLVVGLGVTCLLWSGCRRVAHREPAGPSTLEMDAAPIASTVVDRASGCRDQALRFTERALWKSSHGKDDDVLLRWTAHYSRKHEECGVLTEHRLRLEAGGTLTYSELWDPFSAEALAVWTGDSGSAAHGVCRVNVSDRPPVSCLTARFFIDDHMTH